MAKRQSTLSPKRQTERLVRRGNLQNLIFASKWLLGVGNIEKRVVFKAAADALGVAHPSGALAGYELLARFTREFQHSPSPHVATIQAKAAAHAERKLSWSKANDDKFLLSFEWRRLRMLVLTTRGARCECCGATPRDGVRMHVDHIQPRRKHPELALTEANLQVLCEVCNHGKGSWDETDWRADSQKSGESSADSPVTRTGEGDVSQRTVVTGPRLVRRTQEGRGPIELSREATTQTA